VPRWPSPTPDLSTLGKRLQHARQCKRLELRYVAKRWGASRWTLLDHERGKRPVPYERISWYCKLYGVSRKWLVDGEGEGPALPHRMTEVERIMRCL
jgi:transcriptional regulator with XRE-family HTH domain